MWKYQSTPTDGRFSGVARWARVPSGCCPCKSSRRVPAVAGARFSRLEGAWWGDRSGYFLSTNGGSAGEGQVFEYDPRDETLKVIHDAPNANSLDNPDNMTVTPRGGLLLCEAPPEMGSPKGRGS